MNKGLAFLVMLVMLTAMTVVMLRHQSRLLFVEYQSLQAKRDSLNIEWGKLLLEEGAWSEHRRVETLARDRLHMATPVARRVVIVNEQKGVAP
ncbi:MAG: cell division protein FtsL [Acidiferrobacterales bacterium]